MTIWFLSLNHENVFHIQTAMTSAQNKEGARSGKSFCSGQFPTWPLTTHKSTQTHLMVSKENCSFSAQMLNSYITAYVSIYCKLSLKLSNSCKCPSYFIYMMLRNELNRLSITQYWNLPWWKNSSVTFSLHCLLNSQVRHGLQISAHFNAI